jgi:hypothetical protein
MGLNPASDLSEKNCENSELFAPSLKTIKISE